MANVDKRHGIIIENIPKLIKALTGFDESEENYELCEQFAWSIIKHHRNISVNSHEIRRRIDGLCEKFIVANQEQYANILRELFEKFIVHPLCIEHYETDIQWSIINFLLNLSYNPVGSLTRKLQENVEPIIPLICEEDEVETEESKDYWVDLLKADNISHTDDIDDSSLLSDWSDSEYDEIIEFEKNEDVNITCNQKNQQLSIINPIQPPKKPLHFSEFDSSVSEEWLYTNIQNSWWLNDNTTCKVTTIHDNASFCEIWNNHLSSVTNNSIKVEKIATVSEYCLIREIFWMFISPTSCKFFHIDNNQIIINTNVSLTSTTTVGVQKFLKYYIKYMNIVYKFKKFSNNVSESSDTNCIPHVYESYADSLEDLLKPFYDFIIKKETEIIDTPNENVITILCLYNELQPYFKLLDELNNLHDSSILNWNEYPSHICSSFLIVGLLTKIQESHKSQQTNLAIAVLLKSIRPFLRIIDVWWTEGRLEDWRNEFLIENPLLETTEGFSEFLYIKCKEKSFDDQKNILNNSFIKLIMNHSLEASYSLNILHLLDRINELILKSGFSDNLYESFIENVLNTINTFNPHAISPNENNKLCETNNYINFSYNTNNKINMEQIQNEISDGDELLLLAFEETLTQSLDYQNDSLAKANCFNINNSYDIYERLNSSSETILPFEQIIFDVLSKLLEAKISFANQFVINMYKEEFLVFKHLKNIRKVLLLEASDLMHHFYTSLFSEIETGSNWASTYLLTLRLDSSIIYSKYSDLLSLFKVEIAADCEYDSIKVIDAIDNITIHYNSTNNVMNMVDDKNLEDYNKVFRFLLKVKWGLWTLEKLRFPLSYKKRPPFREFSIYDIVFKRLAMLRFWMLYAVQCIHGHLMTQVLQSMGIEFDQKIDNAKKLSDIITIHDSFIKTVTNYCFQNDEGSELRFGIHQLLHLILVLRDEWNNISLIVEQSDSINFSGNTTIDECSHIDDIETTYINCHEYFAEILNKEVYINQKVHLSGLCAAFNCSIPY